MSMIKIKYVNYSFSNKLMLKLASVINPSSYAGYLSLNDKMMRIKDLEVPHIYHHPDDTDNEFSTPDIKHLKKFFKAVKETEKLFNKEIK